MQPPRPDRDWFDEPRHGRLVVGAVGAVCALTALADLFYSKHAHFAWELWPGVHGLFGFASCVFLVLAAKVLRRLVRRDEDFYDR